MRSTANHSKAIFLLLVFSLNTVVSFACSLGGLFHSFHHHTNYAASAHSHGHHQQKEGHHHDHGNTSHHQEEQAPEKPADDCCSKNVVQLDKVEKATSKVIEAPGVVFSTLFLLSYTSLFSQLPPEGTLNYPSFIRWRLPTTIQDLRIVIQSFQI
jgi:hypothetical protein